MVNSGTASARRKVFINYRRTDNPDFVERIRDWFLMRYGRDSVFMDFDTIPPFTRFADFIRQKVKDSDVLIAIIGPQWVDLLRERLSQADEEDYVQLEIRLALEEGKLIAPICIKGAGVPRLADLPPELRPMLEYNMAHLNSGRSFLDNIELIMDAVERELAQLDGLALLTKDMESASAASTSPFNIREAITSFETASDQQDWQTALDWLARIRTSGYMPRFYPIDDYEREIHEQMRRTQIEQDYDVIRMMADRARKRREKPDRIWTALLELWRTNPGYDPDGLAVEFGPERTPINATLFITQDDQMLEAEGQVIGIPHFDAALLDQLPSVDLQAADALFEPEQLAALVQEPAQPERVSLAEVQALGMPIHLDNTD
jgi:hypothetical protein